MRLLLDAHVSPAVARRLAAAGIDAVAVRDWQGGNYRHAADDQLLLAAATEGRVLVTFDARSIQPLAREWAEIGRHHAGVIVVSGKTIRQDDVGGLIRALRALATAAGEQGWQDRLVFLRADSGG
jgi:predicted nuclease of predicted toxin-antitoxin system